jgi:hypothetical protein
VPLFLVRGMMDHKKPKEKRTTADNSPRQRQADGCRYRG